MRRQLFYLLNRSVHLRKVNKNSAADRQLRRVCCKQLGSTSWCVKLQLRSDRTISYVSLLWIRFRVHGRAYDL